MKKIILRFSVLAFFICFVSNICFGQLTVEKIDALVKNSMAKFKTAGVAVGIVKDGKVIYSKGFGVKLTQTNSPVDENTNFAIASNSYEDVWFGKMEIFKNGEKLWIKSHRSPKLNRQMFFYKANTFAIKWEYRDMNADAFAMFQLDENGKASGFKMKGISPNIDFSFDFHDLDLKRIKSQ
jgi:hypothetical protein